MYRNSINRRLFSLLFAIFVFVFCSASTCLAESYALSGSPDGTGKFVVDDRLVVTVNGALISDDGPANAGERIPIPVPANIGDQLRIAVHDTYGDCRILSRLILTDSSGRFAVLFDPIADAFPGSCGNPINTGEVYSKTFVIPGMQTPAAYSDTGMPGSAFAGLVPAPDGRLFGVTYSGGAFSKGTLYYLDSVTQAVTVVHDFSGIGDGQVPYNELVYDPVSQKLYGTTSDTVGDPGTIFSYVPATNTFNTVISDFGGRAQPQRQLVIRNNHIYGVLARGGFVGNPVVFRVATNGTGFTIIHEFDDFRALPNR